MCILWVRFWFFDVIPLFPLLSFWIHRFLNFENSILVNLVDYSFFMRSFLNKLIHRIHIDFTPSQLCSTNFGLRPFVCSQTDLQVHSGACWIRVFQLETLIKLCFWQLHAANWIRKWLQTTQTRKSSSRGISGNSEHRSKLQNRSLSSNCEFKNVLNAPAFRVLFIDLSGGFWGCFQKTVLGVAEHPDWLKRLPHTPIDRRNSPEQPKTSNTQFRTRIWNLARFFV